MVIVQGWTEGEMWSSFFDAGKSLTFARWNSSRDLLHNSMDIVNITELHIQNGWGEILYYVFITIVFKKQDTDDL